MRPARFSPGAVILRQGEPVAALYLLTSGTVSIVLGEKEDARRVSELGPGAWLGELALLTGAVSSATVVADSQVEALSVTQAEFLSAADEDPAIFRELAHALASRLRSTDRMFHRKQAARVVLLWHNRSQTPLVEQVLDECFRWAPVPLLALSNSVGAAGSTPSEYLDHPSRLTTLQRRLAAGQRVINPTGDLADPALSRFLGLASEFAPIIVIALSQPISPAAMTRITETVALEEGAGRSAPVTRMLDVPHVVWQTGERFDAGRVARWICRQRVGLALGGGAARGFAHLGVLRALEEAGVPIDAVAGTSVGAAIAASVAAGTPVDEIANAVEVTGRAALVPQLIPLHSVFTNVFLRMALARDITARRFSDLELPLAVTAVDLDTAEELVFTSGELIPALLASTALPGIFPPVRHGGRILVDGGLRVPVPVAECYALGADVVIASHMRVDADRSARRPERVALPWLADTFSQALDIMQDRIGREASALADIRIETAIPRRYAGLFDFNHRSFVEDAGAQAARAVLPQIVERLPGLRARDGRSVRRAA
jgi:NTE family protein